MEKEFLMEYKKWLNSPQLDENDKKELLCIESDIDEIENRFYADLEFGTAGMRGIRGVGRNRINKYNVRKVSQGVADYIIKTTGDVGKEKGVVIAYDCRIASFEYALNTALVFAGNGIKTYLFDGLRSTPELSFATRELKCQAGVMITASHNPKEYNGYKVYWEDGAQIVEPHASKIVDSVNNVAIFEDVKIIDEEKARELRLLINVDKIIDDRYILAVKNESVNLNIANKENFKIVYSPLHGTGGKPVKRVLKEMNFNSLYVVPEQEGGDGNFPTCSYANPEDISVFKMSTELADRISATLCLTNDPDADRTGIAIKDNNGEWYYPTGNQLGVILLDYLIKARKNISKNATIVSTIVSTPMIDKIATVNNIKVCRTLTGFKYIGEKIREFETKEVDGEYFFGFEESLGYLIGTYVRDKDGIVTTLLISEMASYYDSIGTSIYKELQKLYDKYGWYKEETLSFTKNGKSGLEDIKNIMKKLREKERTHIGKIKIEKVTDYKLQIEKNLVNGECKNIKLPISDVIQFILEGETVITVRPSGTEPKIKYYFSVLDESENLSREKLEWIKTIFLEWIDTL